MKNETNVTGMAVKDGLQMQEIFPTNTYAEWRSAAEALLKGAPFEKRMITKTLEGFDIQPIYNPEDIADLPHIGNLPGTGNRSRGNSAAGNLATPWLISQELKAGSAQELNLKAKNAIKHGQTELNFSASLKNLEEMETTLEGIDLSKVSIALRHGSSSYALLKAYAEKKGIDLSEVKGSVASDPIHQLAKTGKLGKSFDTVFDETAQRIQDAATKAPGIQNLIFCGEAYHDGGAGVVHELACVLASAVNSTRELQKRGITFDTIAKQSRLSLSLGTDFFMEMAKIRASRILWARIAEAFGGSEESKSVHVHAKTGWWSMTRKDSNVNMLRSTTEAFAAVVGGCNSLTVTPHDSILGHTSEQSERVARNLQIILQEECELTRTLDPVGGSYYVEWLTDQIAKNAWEFFQKIEAEGGMIEALKKGFVQDTLSTLAGKKAKSIAQRRKVIVGTNMYPNADEAAAPKADAACCCCSNATPAITVNAITTRRASEDFEELRDASDAMKAKTGQAPTLLQANFGPSRRYRMRADWTSAFFQTGGIKVISDKDFDTAEAVVEAAEAAGVKVVVIVSTDADYESCVPDIAKALKAKGDYTVIVAGAAGDNEAAWKEAGVDDYVNVRVNNYEMNVSLLKKMGAIAN